MIEPKNYNLNSFKDSLGSNLNENKFLTDENTSGKNFNSQSIISDVSKNADIINNFYNNENTQNYSNLSNSILKNNISQKFNKNVANSNFKTASENLITNSSSKFNENFVMNNVNSEENVLQNSKMQNLRGNSDKQSENKISTDVKVDMSGMQNIISKDTDIDKVIREISKKLEEALTTSSKGVH